MSEQTEEATVVNNDHVSVEITKEPGCQVTLQISVLPASVQSDYRKAVKTINKEVTVPGFRKGKAPADRIVSQFGPHIDKEWQDLVTNTAYKEALALTKLYPLSQEAIKSVKVESCDKEEGAKVKIEYESFPEVPELKIEDLSIEPVAAEEVTDEMFATALDELRDVYMTFDDVEDGVVETGHFVELDIDAIEEDHSHNLCRDRMFCVEDEKMGQWMQALVTGKKVGDEMEGESEWEASSGISEEEFKPTKCKITIKAIKKGVRPEEDIELAKKSGLETAEELHENIRKDLVLRMERKGREQTKEVVQKLLVETFPFDLPKTMVEQEKAHIMHNQGLAMKRENLSEELMKQRQSELEQEADAAASVEVQMSFLAGKLSDQFKIQITTEELQSELQRQMYMVPEEDRVVDPSRMQPEVIRQRLVDYIIKERVKEHLAIALAKEKA